MSAPFFVPFNFCPSSVSVKTSSYTIPAGYYARVVAYVGGDGSFKIDTVAAIFGTQNTVITAGNNLYRTSGTPTSATADTIGTLNSKPLSNTNGTTTTSVVSVFGSDTNQTPIVADFWIPAGTVVNGTGTWTATISLYPQLT